MTDQHERRYLTAGLEVRAAAADSDEPAKLCGYAAKFNTRSENLGGFREIILPGAFDDVLKDDVRALLNHDYNLILGRTLSGTLRILQDTVGLYYECTLPDTQAARDLAVSIARGDISQSSFSFRLAAGGDSWDEDEEGVIIRTVKKVGRLYDVSPVTLPAYPDTTTATRSLSNWKNQAQHVLKAKRDAERRARYLRTI